MRDDTPYHTRPDREIANEMACMEKIFEQALPVSNIYEAFGGIGKTASILHNRFPKAVIQAFDLDLKCCNLYNKATKDYGHCLQLDALEGFQRHFPPSHSWGASLDFNRFTLLDLTRPEGLWKRRLIKEVCKRKPSWLQLTDSAVAYLGTNWSRYDLSKKDLSDYVNKLSEALKAYNLKLVTYANHSRATYLLFCYKRIRLKDPQMESVV